MNWMSRIALFAVLGAILSSAVLVGCGGNSDDSGSTNAATNAASNSAGGE